MSPISQEGHAGADAGLDACREPGGLHVVYEALVLQLCASMIIGDGFKARLEFVLELVFENLSSGGDHATRAFVAQRLLKAAQAGIVKLEDLKQVAKDALLDALQAPRSV